MAEPLSITTAVVTLLKTTWTVGAELKKFHDGVSVISKTLSDLENDTVVLAEVLASLRDTFETIKAENEVGHLASHWANVAKAISNGNGIIQELGDELQDINKSTKFLDMPRKQLRLNLAEDKLAGLRTRVQSLRDTLQLSLQAITVTNQASYQTSLNDLSREIRRLAKHFNENIGIHQGHGRSEQAEVHLKEMVNLRECVKSAASIVSSASSATMSQGENNQGSSVIMSDFADCFPMEHPIAIRRWMEAPSIREYDNRSVPPPQSAAEVFSVDENVDSSDSDVDLEDEITTALMENGEQKLASGDLRGAERILKKCSSRLSHATWEQRGSHAGKQLVKHVEVLHILFIIYQRQESWTEAQNALAQKLKVRERLNRKKDSMYLQDVITLAKTLQRTGDTIQALLHARHALRGYKRLQSTGDIRSCLEFLIELCNAADHEDDAEAYMIMLMRMRSAQPSSSEDAAVHTSSPSVDPTMIDLTQEADKLSTCPNKASFLERPVIDYANTSRPEKLSVSVARRVWETAGDFLPFESRPDNNTRQRDAKFHEALLDSEETRVEPSSMSSHVSFEEDVEDSADIDDGLPEGDPIDTYLWFESQEQDIANGDISMSIPNFQRDDEPQADFEGSLGMNASEDSTIVDHASAGFPAYEKSPIKNSSERSTTLDTLDAHDWARSAIASLAETQKGADKRLGAFTVKRKPLQTTFSLISATDPSRPETPLLRPGPTPGGDEDLASQKNELNDLPDRPVNIHMAPEVPELTISIDDSPKVIETPFKLLNAAAADDVFSTSPAVHPTQHQDSFQYDHNSDETTTKKHLNERNGSGYNLRLSPSSSASSVLFAAHSTTTTSDIASPASTNVTMPSDGSPDIQQRRNNRTSRTDLLHTESKNSQLLTPRHSWTKEAADYELAITGSDVKHPSSTDAGVAATDCRRSKSVTVEDKFGAGVSEDVEAQSEDALSPLAKLTANNLAQASNDSSTEFARRATNSSVLSLAGHSTITSIEDLKTQQQETAGELRKAHITLMGDGMCGKTSLLRRFATDDSFSEWLDIGFHHCTVPVELDGENVLLKLYDAPGQEGNGIIELSIQSADCLILCFAIDFPKSLQNLIDKWIHNVPRRGSTPVPVLLVGCRSDLRDNPDTMRYFKYMDQRLLTGDECRAAQKNLRAFSYLECSAKTGDGVDIVVKTAARAALPPKSTAGKRKKSRFKFFR